MQFWGWEASSGCTQKILGRSQNSQRWDRELIISGAKKGTLGSHFWVSATFQLPATPSNNIFLWSGVESEKAKNLTFFKAVYCDGKRNWGFILALPPPSTHFPSPGLSSLICQRVYSSLNAFIYTNSIPTPAGIKNKGVYWVMTLYLKMWVKLICGSVSILGDPLGSVLWEPVPPSRLKVSQHHTWSQ